MTLITRITGMILMSYVLFGLQCNIWIIDVPFYISGIYFGVIDGINISNIWCYLCPIIACVKYRVVKFSNSFFEIICHKLLPFLKMPFEQYIREGSGYEIGWIFRKVPKRGRGVIFNPQIYIVDMWPLYRALFGCFETTICDIIFRKWGGGSQRPFGILKIHPIW